MFTLHDETYVEECPRAHEDAVIADSDAFAAEAARGQDGNACPVCAGYARADALGLDTTGGRRSWSGRYDREV